MRMIRPFPNQTDRMSEFLEKNIVAVYWGIDDVTGCTSKSDIAKVVDKANLKPRDASLKTGLLFSFAREIRIDEYVIVPYLNDTFYIAQIESDYYYDENCITFEHQRKVKWLFDGKSFHRDELPNEIQKSIKTQLGFANISQHESLFSKYLMNKESSNIVGVNNDIDLPLVSDMNSLLADAINVLKEEIHSEDSNRRLQAAIAIVGLKQQRE